MEDKKYEMKNAHLSMKLLQKCKEGHLEMFCQVPCLNGNFEIRREGENVAKKNKWMFLPTYGSYSAGRGKRLFYVIFLLKVEPPCD